MSNAQRTRPPVAASRSGYRPVQAGGPSVTPNVPARPPQAVQPDEPPAVDVRVLLSDLDSANRQLQINAAAYAVLNRGAESKMAKGNLPIMSWTTAGIDGTVIEVQSDLDEMPAASQPVVFDILINLHGDQMIENVEAIIANAVALRDALNRSASAVEPQAVGTDDPAEEPAEQEL
jgi:hypothetical protein